LVVKNKMTIFTKEILITKTINTMKKILTVLTVITFTIVSCQKEEPVEPQVAAKTSSSSTGNTGNGNTGNTDPTVSASKFFVGFSVANNVYSIDHPDVTINGVPLTYAAENYNTLSVNEGVIDRAFEYDIPSGLVNCNDSIDYTVTFTDDDIVGVTIYDIQVFSSMDGYDVQCMNQRWSGWTQWEKPLSVPYQVVRINKIKYICN
jgi:hypothetical protein